MGSIVARLTPVRAWFERVLLRLGALTAHRGRPADRLLLVASTGDGNIGDQALFESIVRWSPVPVDVVVDSPTSFVVPQSLRDRVSLHPFGSYVYGRNVAHLIELVQIGRLVAGHRSTAVVGADIMDGGYNSSMSCVRWSVATVAASIGRHSAVTSMSWNGRPAPGIAALARRAARRGVVVAARDPQSHTRLVEAGVRGARLVADVVFSLEPQDEPPADVLSGFAAWRQEDRPLVLLNVSGLVGTPGWAAAEYRQVVEGLTELGAQVLLVPHVSRPGNDDVVSQDQVLPASSWPQLGRVSRLLLPTQIAWLAARSTLVITGRMHLSILALSRGVPAVVLSTQGKVSGLLKSVGLSEACIDPEPGLGAAILAVAGPVLQDPGAIRARIEEHLPQLRHRSLQALEVTLPATARGAR